MVQIWMMTKFCPLRSAYEKVKNGTDLEDDMFPYPFSALKDVRAGTESTEYSNLSHFGTIKSQNLWYKIKQLFQSVPF